MAARLAPNGHSSLPYHLQSGSMLHTSSCSKVTKHHHLL
jgi:hypothetical protein